MAGLDSYTGKFGVAIWHEGKWTISIHDSEDVAMEHADKWGMQWSRVFVFKVSADMRDGVEFWKK